MFFPRVLTNTKGVRQDIYIGGLPRQVWHKPPNCTMVYVMCLGAGGSGGAGRTGAAGTARGGGSGGGSGAIATLLIPAICVPKVLFPLPGGVGVTSGGSTFSGGSSIILERESMTTPSTTQAFFRSGLTSSTGGTSGGVAGSVAGGTGETILTAGSCTYMAWGVWTALAGQAGAASGALGGAGVSISVTTNPVSGGAGGGSVTTTNTDVAGGGITTGTVFLPNIPGGVAAAGAGSNGMSMWEPMFFYGGAGGGTAGAAGTAGRGGAGAFGCGGGGGGSGVTGGNGGSGGAGVIIIASW